MKFDEIINEDYENYYDTNLLKTTGMKPLVDAITNRRPITFMYTGPGMALSRRGLLQESDSPAGPAGLCLDVDDRHRFFSFYPWRIVSVALTLFQKSCCK